LVQFLLLVKVAREGIQLLAPELLVTRHPGRGLFHRRRGKLAADHSALLGPRNQPCILEHLQVFHESGQRHLVRSGKLADREVAVVGERLENVPPRPVGERGEEGVQVVVRILNHQV
jgi:hypothetical protein